jgi:hypothetical protein
MANIQRTLDLVYDDLIIGSDLSALCYSYINKIPIVYTKINKPDPFSMFDDKIKSIDKWQEIMFLLSINHLSPFSNIVQSIRLADSNLLKITTKENFVCNISYKNLFLFDEQNINGLASINKTNSRNLVIDWFDAQKGIQIINHNLELDDDFVKTIKINQDEAKIAAISYLSDEEIKNQDFDISLSRMKVLRELKKYNAKGNLKSAITGECKKLIVNISHREIYPYGKTLYNDMLENFHIIDKTPQEILKSDKKEHKYFNHIERILLNATRKNC